MESHASHASHAWCSSPFTPGFGVKRVKTTISLERERNALVKRNQELEQALRQVTAERDELLQRIERIQNTK